MPRHTTLLAAAFLTLGTSLTSQTSLYAETPDNLKDENLIAWCIVPFDSQHRSPAERAEMVKRLGLRRVAYDWRAEHVAEFEEEILQYKKHGIEYFAFWGEHEKAFELFAKYEMSPQIWQFSHTPPEGTQEERVKAAADRLLPLVEKTRKLGSKLGLYNHGAWGGEPENMVAICEYLHQHHDAKHVGIVYNLHHGHDHVAEFPKQLKLMKPYLLCLNLNGMMELGEGHSFKILPLSRGENDVTLLKQIVDSGYTGPIGIIGHTQDDVEKRLQDNLDGLHWMLPQLDGQEPGPKPAFRTFDYFPFAKMKGELLEGKVEYRKAPITIQCRARLNSSENYNILVASDTKASGAHWELFSMHTEGTLSAYLPGMKPDHVLAKVNICDNVPHNLTMTYAADTVKLFVDGKEVAEQKVEPTGKAAVPEISKPSQLGVGRLVEGGLGCRGSIQWVTITSGIQEAETAHEPASSDKTLLLWKPTDTKQSQLDVHQHDAHQDHSTTKFVTPEYSEAVVNKLIAQAEAYGDAHRGLLAFASSKAACLSCHRLGKHGGTVGPDLSQVGKERTTAQLTEAVLWPKREVKSQYVVHSVLDTEGRIHRGYLVKESETEILLRDPTKSDAAETRIAKSEIDAHKQVGTLMPDNLAATFSPTDLSHLLVFLSGLGTVDAIPTAEMDSLLSHALAHTNGPATFEFDRTPLHPELWPNWQHHVNRDRVYDFYAKEAEHFRTAENAPPLLMEFPGLDGGKLGHWGNQDDSLWEDDRWNKTDLGSVHAGVFHGQGIVVPRAVCVRLQDDKSGKTYAVCFNPETLNYEAIWSDGFLAFDTRRHGFLGGVRPKGSPLPKPDPTRPKETFTYLGYSRYGEHVLFRYRVDDVEYLSVPQFKDGKFQPLIAKADEHPLKHLLTDPPAIWPQVFETKIELGKASPYALDEIHLPTDNPWNAMIYCGGHAFLPDGSAVICTMHGDVWRVSDFAYPSTTAKWKRFASGLHHPLGMVADEDGIFVLGRDQITRLHDQNDDGEADYYECFSNAFVTSAGGHDFIAGLERDKQGNFYIASGNQGVVQISSDGKTAKVVATGFRNPDGLGILADGSVTVPCSEGSWTPASMICQFKPSADSVPHFGYPGPRDNQPPALPLAYLPRALDNSSGGQVQVTSEKWGPLSGSLLHFSFGMGRHFLLLSHQVDGQPQAAVVPLPGEFLSGAHRGRFHPKDGQLYVTGMQGWSSYTPNDGCFTRVRYTGEPVQLPISFHVYKNGVTVRFSRPLDKSVAENVKSHFAQCWNYRYSSGYGSPEFSTKHPGMRGHDTVAIRSAHLLDNGETLFLEIPELQPVNQLHLHLQTHPGKFQELFATLHKLDVPFTNFEGYKSESKTIQPHPILADLAMATRSIPNPYTQKLENAREITLRTATNLSFQTRELRVKAGEPIALTLQNPDVVPHNWALVESGKLEEVGPLTDKLISDPDAAIRHYIPKSDAILVHTNVVLPKEQFTIYFRAPQKPGSYPYLCTFPGHWKVMNGVMIVE